MPAKKTAQLTDEERARRIRETAREIGTKNDPKACDEAFGALAKRFKLTPDKPKSGGSYEPWPSSGKWSREV